jgi:hypothetical protein
MLFNCLCMSIMNLHCYFFLPTRSCLANQIRLTILALLSMWIVYILLFFVLKMGTLLVHENTNSTH